MVKAWVESNAIRHAAIAAAVLLVLTPAALMARGDDRRAPAISMSFDRFSNFTPASADPRLAAAFGSRAPSAVDFHFTPAAAKSRPSQVRVAIRARTVNPQSVAGSVANASVGLTALAPATYNLGLAVGWRRFAVSGDVAKVASVGSPVGGSESAAVGISYSLNRFTGRVAVAGDRSSGVTAPALAKKENVALDVGGAFSLTRGIALTGGVRYKIERERLATLADRRRDSQAVYVGTAFKF